MQSNKPQAKLLQTASLNSMHNLLKQTLLLYDVSPVCVAPPVLCRAQSCKQGYCRQLHQTACMTLVLLYVSIFVCGAKGCKQKSCRQLCSIACVSFTLRMYHTSCAVQSKKLQAEMLQTAPPSSVHDVAFPCQYSEVFAACGLGEIRIWHLQSRRELLRMSVPNLDCRCVAFMQVSRCIA